MVIDVVTSPSGMPSKSASMSASDATRHAALPHFARDERVVGVAAHQRRQIERDAEAGAAGREQVPIPALVSSGVPNPANCRIVQSLPR